MSSSASAMGAFFSALGAVGRQPKKKRRKKAAKSSSSSGSPSTRSGDPFDKEQCRLVELQPYQKRLDQLTEPQLMHLLSRLGFTETKTLGKKSKKLRSIAQGRHKRDKKLLATLPKAGYKKRMASLLCSCLCLKAKDAFPTEAERDGPEQYATC